MGAPRGNLSTTPAEDADARDDPAVADVGDRLTQRLAQRLGAPELALRREATLKAVAAHEMDPYTAADALLELLRG